MTALAPDPIEWEFFALLHYPLKSRGLNNKVNLTVKSLLLREFIRRLANKTNRPPRVDLHRLISQAESKLELRFQLHGATPAGSGEAMWRLRHLLC